MLSYWWFSKHLSPAVSESRQHWTDPLEQSRTGLLLAPQARGLWRPDLWKTPYTMHQIKGEVAQVIRPCCPQKIQCRCHDLRSWSHSPQKKWISSHQLQVTSDTFPLLPAAADRSHERLGSVVFLLPTFQRFSKGPQPRLNSENDDEPR